MFILFDRAWILCNYVWKISIKNLSRTTEKGGLIGYAIGTLWSAVWEGVTLIGCEPLGEHLIYLTCAVRSISHDFLT